MEADRDKQKLASLLRWASNQRNSTSLAEYVENRKKGQTQIFFLAGLGQSPEALSKSLFVEKLTARVCTSLLWVIKILLMMVLRAMKYYWCRSPWTKSYSQLSVYGSK